MTTRRDVMLSEYFKVPAAAIWGFGRLRIRASSSSTSTAAPLL